MLKGNELAVAGLLALCALAGCRGGEESAATAAELAALRREVADLRQEVAQLRQELAGRQAFGVAEMAEALAGLREEIFRNPEGLMEELSRELEAGGFESLRAALLPEIDELRRLIEERLGATPGPQAGNEDEPPLALAPAAPPEPPALAPGLAAEIFQLPEGGWPRPSWDPASRLLRRVDQQVDFSWGEGPPGPEPELVPDGFAIRWTGYLRVAEPGDYVLATLTDDGARLFLGGERLIDDWNLHGVEAHRRAVRLEPGLYPLRLEYFESGGGADCRLWWRPPGAADEGPIPAANLFHDPAALGPTAAPTRDAEGL